MDYLLENLDSGRFQELCQSLLIKEHPRIQCLPISQSDGGRDAIAYFQPDKNGREFIVFQIKQVKLQPSDARKWLIDIVKKEAPKVNKLIPKGAISYYLITNVRGSAHLGTGSIDQVTKILSDEIEIPSMCWWLDDLNRRLDNAWDLKWAYPEILTGTDMLRFILEAGLGVENRRLISIIEAFLQGQYIKDEVVRFKQGGLLQSKLTSLFIDVPILVGDTLEGRKFSHFLRKMARTYYHIEADEIESFEHSTLPYDISLYGLKYEEQISLGGARMLLHPTVQERIPLIVLEGAPGQGKSTIVQYVCQMHRMRILNENFDKIPNYYKPASLRVPIKIDLRDYATWLNGQDPFSPLEEKVKSEEWNKSLEAFLAYQIKYDSAGIKFSVSDLRAVAKLSSLLLVLDGFDEIADISKREEIVAEVIDCTKRLRMIAASLQVVITSRPAAFANSPGFPEKLFSHIELTSLTIPQINDYAAKWANAQELDSRDTNEVKRVLKVKLNQPHMRDLARNPMQLAILLTLIHLRGPSLPDQRTALYDSYVERFFDRESDKNVVVRENRPLLINIHSYLAWILHSEAEQGRERGSISAEKLQRLITEYLTREEFDVELAEKLSITTVERVFFLVSRVQGTFEFEVQPLREYFAARYLYKTAPYLPVGMMRHGSILDRFEAIAMNFYWFNVTRFYTGFYSEGELPSLFYQLQDLVQKDGYRYISYPRVLVATLLSDSIFAQLKKVMRDVFSLMLDSLGIRFFNGGSFRDANTNTLLVLPKDCGKSELINYCINELHKYHASDYVQLFTDLLKANCELSELKELWLKEALSLVGEKRTIWVRYGLLLETLPHLRREEVEQLLSDDPYNIERVTLLFRVLPVEKIEKLEQRYNVYINSLMSGNLIIPLKSKNKSIIDIFSQVMNARRYGTIFKNPLSTPLVAYWKQRDINPVDLNKIQEVPGLTFDENAKLLKILEVVKVEQNRTLKQWATELTSWNEIVENCRSLWGEQWLFFHFANIASGIKSSAETCKDYPDLLDQSKSLCKRARYARLRAGAADWWQKQLEETLDEQDKMFSLLILLTWGRSTTIANLAEVIDSQLDQLSIVNWHRLFRSLNQAIEILFSSTDKERLTIDAETLPANLSAKTVTVLGMRAKLGEALEYGRRRDCSRHRQSRTVHDRFRSHGSSVHGHVSWIPAALCLAILAKSSAVFSSWQCR